MSGRRINDTSLTQQEWFEPELRIMVDRMDTGSGDWLEARNMEISLLGNTYIQGSANNINWHDDVAANDTYFKLSTDGGTTWRTVDSDLIREGSTNLYFTEARVLAATGVQDAVDNSHTHSNQTTLDNITGDGDGHSVLKNDGTYQAGATGSFTTTDGKTITVTDGIISSIT